MRPRRFGHARTGQTLIELVGATTIMAVALVPALRMMRDSLRVGRDLETSNLLATLAASKLEEHLVRTATAWDTTADNGTATGYPGIRYSVVKVDEAVGSGLMRITATAWEDRNGNATWDAGEKRSVFASKLARNAAYQQEASGA